MAWPTTTRPSTCTRNPFPAAIIASCAWARATIRKEAAWEPILLVDFGMGVRERGPDPDEAGYVQGDDRYPVVNITPQVFIPRRSEPGWRFLTKEGKYVHDAEGRKGHLYTHPYPVSDRKFLVSYKVNPADHYKDVANAYALYLIDTEGHHRPVHADAKLSCWHPLPLVARPVPPRVQSFRDPQYAASNQALCVVANVYQGMEGVEPGEVKWLRINEALPRYWSTSRRWEPSLSSSSWKAALWPRVQWGVVPVEKDGSAHFVVPANRSIFFQALDENFREIQRERTYVNYAPGEVRSCTGCHGQSNRTASRGRLRHAAGVDPAAEHAPAATVRSGGQRRRRPAPARSSTTPPTSSRSSTPSASSATARRIPPAG